jgi:L-ascorbate metabolism protein UlaG (beta-lactamase superfamily)
MTQDEIIEMAKQAKAIPMHKDFNQLALIGTENIEAFAKLVAEKSYDQGWKDCMDEHLIPRIEFNPKDSV